MSLRGVTCPRDLFRRHVAGRPCADLVLAQFLDQRGEAKISNPDPPAAIHHDVGGFEITVDDAQLMSCSKSRAELMRNLQTFIGVQSPNTLQQRGQVFAVDELHRDKWTIVTLGNVENTADIGMCDLSCDTDFALHLGPGVGDMRNRLWQELQGSVWPKRKSSARYSSPIRPAQRASRCGIVWTTASRAQIALEGSLVSAKR